MSRISSSRRPPASCPRTIPPVHSLRRERNTKRRGELAELVFLLIATRLGFGVSKPYGDSERYDFILDSRDVGISTAAHGGAGAPARPAARKYRAAAVPAALATERPAPLWRIQVKCSTQLLNGLYRVNAHRRSGGRALPYLPGEIDFIAAYIIPEDTWYIIPVHAVRGTSLLFRRKKDHRPGLYDQYRQAWRLLRPRS
ncbi:MAG TPA: group I intron-associated PD-(D/E)XK endonuclease [Terracidiphilus sp.]|nr:group I intron-associated PD-(D/E)XK endonuclease [Terracidiphilus sp.]